MVKHACLFHLCLISAPYREFLRVFHKTLFQNKGDLVVFIQHSHSICLKLNQRKRRSIMKLGINHKSLDMVLKEVCIDVLINLEVGASKLDVA